MRLVHHVPVVVGALRQETECRHAEPHAAAATDHFSEFNGSGMSLGLVKGVAYEEHLFSGVQSGQVIMALTDGLWEAFNRDGEMFGKDRVRNLVRRFANLSAAEMSERINAELSRFLGAKSPDDDLTFVIVKVL